MIDDLQKASLLKRIAAYLLDLILLSIIIVGAASLLSYLTKFDANVERLNGYYDQYAQKYGVDFDISNEDYMALSEAERQVYDDAFAAMNKDDVAVDCYNRIVNTTFFIATVSILVGYLLLEFAIPRVFRNGQTIGKKVFSLGVIRTDCVQMSTMQLFVRTVLGKCTIETLVPAMVVLMIYLGIPNLVALLALASVVLIQLGMLVLTPTHTAIHDRMSSTVVVDMSSQMVFESPEHLMEYKKQRHKQMAEDRPYF